MSAPDKIYLQIGDYDNPEVIPDDDWYTGNITWCVDKIDDNDLEYVAAAELEALKSIKFYLQSFMELDSEPDSNGYIVVRIPRGEYFSAAELLKGEK